MVAEVEKPAGTSEGAAGGTGTGAGVLGMMGVTDVAAVGADVYSGLTYSPTKLLAGALLETVSRLGPRFVLVPAPLVIPTRTYPSSV
jgi:hypothetical protein